LIRISDSVDGRQVVLPTPRPGGDVEERQPVRGEHPGALGRPALARLAAADAFGSLGLSRRAALWQVLSLGEELPLFAGLFVTGCEDLVDFNCQSAKEEKMCFATDCPFNLEQYKTSLLNRRTYERLACRPFNGLFLPEKHL
jgi:hypothetical protein